MTEADRWQPTLCQDGTTQSALEVADVTGLADLSALADRGPAHHPPRTSAPRACCRMRVLADPHRLDVEGFTLGYDMIAPSPS